MLLFALLFWGCTESVSPIVPVTRQALAEIIKEQNIDSKDLILEISKCDLILTLYHKKEALRSYPIVLGGNTVDDKLQEGDRCTPEGKFGIRDMYPHKSWSYFIWVDYPNEESWSKHNAAIKAGKIPQNASIGGEIGIHGVPEGKDYLIDNQEHWTLGCIALKSADIEDLYKAISKETAIVIR